MCPRIGVRLGGNTEVEEPAFLPQDGEQEGAWHLRHLQEPEGVQNLAVVPLGIVRARQRRDAGVLEEILDACGQPFINDPVGGRDPPPVEIPEGHRRPTVLAPSVVHEEVVLEGPDRPFGLGAESPVEAAPEVAQPPEIPLELPNQLSLGGRPARKSHTWLAVRQCHGSPLTPFLVSSGHRAGPRLVE